MAAMVMASKRKMKDTSFLGALLDRAVTFNEDDVGPKPKRVKQREVILSVDPLRRICSFLTTAQDVASFSAVNHNFLTAALMEKKHALTPGGILDVKKVFFDKQLF
ncbi:hypothetical protein L596_014037 [Steinernema carpocapsae]|uniref:Uncharacterized protein n=1 Tax=Steinernema carpocapsae TaxID=34508 RepID=A0A4U5NBV8_STECR|nr:hypothetical protein L596_014037 [Steinernema carpocapsae]